MNNKLYTLFILAVGVVVGISGTLGVQTFLPSTSLTSSSNEGSSSSSSLPRPQYTGFETEGIVQEAVPYETYWNTFYPEDPREDQVFFEVDYEDVYRLDDGTFFAYDYQSVQEGSKFLYFTQLTHLDTEGDPIWEFDILPSNQFMSAATAINDIFELYTDIQEVETEGDTVILLLEIPNKPSILNIDTQLEESLYVGGDYEVFGASNLRNEPYLATSVTLDLQAYTFQVQQVFGLTDQTDFIWGGLYNFNFYYLLHIIVVIENPDIPKVSFAGLLDPNFRFHHYFSSFTLNLSNDFVLQEEGHFKTNLLFNLDFYTLYDFEGKQYSALPHIHHFLLEFFYISYLNSDQFETPSALVFSEDFSLITDERQQDVIDYFETMSFNEFLDYAVSSLNFIYDADARHFIYPVVLSWHKLTYQPSSYETVMFSFEDHANFIVTISKEEYNYVDDAFRLLNTESTIFWIENNQPVATLELKDQNQLFVNAIIKMDDGFIMGGYTSQMDYLTYDGNFDASLALILVNDDGQFLDGQLIETRANSWINELRVINDILYVSFWTNSSLPLFTEMELTFGSVFFFQFPLILA